MIETSLVIKQLEGFESKLLEIGELFDFPSLVANLKKLEEQMSQVGFWDKQEQALKTTQAVSNTKANIAIYRDLETKINDAKEYLQFYIDEPEEEIEHTLTALLNSIEVDLNKAELAVLLTEPYDHNNAILSLHPGAGGTESQDWAAMLLRMYTRWAEEQGFKVEFWDYQPDPEAGIKDATLLIKGNNAYGYLKAERGVHRLVRLSPFDSSGRRHTSFASVEVMPELDDDINIEIKTEDLRIETYRASGAGGQHVNKTESAIRITHLPSGIVVQCQNERSQHSNKNTAMRFLKSKLYEKELQEQEMALAKMRGEVSDIAWGNQIRSYVFHPYAMVKDHRTNIETGNTDAVMDGDVSQFIAGYLKWKTQNKTKPN
nr:peptide chain release factor 2 [Clostridium sp. 'deep sea']